MRAVLSTFALPLSAAALVACSGDAERRADRIATGRGGSAVLCTPSLALNPFTSPDIIAADLRPLLYTPLVLYGAGDDFKPHLARSWAWSDGDRTLTFRLREDLHWHDGQPVTAEDVAWTLRVAADPLYAYWSGADFAALEDAGADDGGGVTLRFREPYDHGLEPFALLPILPRHLLESIPPADFANAPYHQAPVGSGPLRFARRTTDGLILLERVDAFPDELGTAGIDRLFLRVIAEPATIVIELRTGGVDACITGSSLAAEIAADTTLRAVALEPGTVQVIPLDARVAPFTDARVRRAFSAALDRAALAAIISPLARPAPTYPSSPAVHAAFAQPDADPALAGALLDSAGWRAGRDGIRVDSAGRPLRFTLMGPQQYQVILTAVQAQLRRAGMAAEIELLEAATYFATIRNPDSRPAAMALGFSPEKVIRPDPRAQLHSSGSSNLASYRSDDVDRLIDALHDARDAAERAQLYGEIQQRVAEDVPAVYTIQVPRMLAVGPRLTGVEADRNGPFGSIANWRVRTR